jgi:hypothetical protein
MCTSFFTVLLAFLLLFCCFVLFLLSNFTVMVTDSGDSAEDVHQSRREAKNTYIYAVTENTRKQKEKCSTR